MDRLDGMMRTYRTRETTKLNHDVMCPHLYVLTVATIEQLSRLTNVDVDALRNQIKRYKLLSVMSKPLVQCVTSNPDDYQSWTYKKANRVSVYHLSREAAVAVEVALGKSYYRDSPKRQPAPTDKDVIRRTVLMNELYIRMVTGGMGAVQWLNSMQFQSELTRLRKLEDATKYDFVNVTCGALQGNYLYGFSLYDDQDLRGLRSLVKRLVQKDDDANCYELLVFVTGNRSGAAAVQCAELPPEYIMVRNPSLRGSGSVKSQASGRNYSDVRSNTAFISYEWALTHPDIVRDILLNDWDGVMWKLLRSELDHSDNRLHKVEGTGWWQIVDKNDRPIEWVCTVIGRSAKSIGLLARVEVNYRSLDNTPSRILVATEEEREVWQDTTYKYGGYLRFEVARMDTIGFESQEQCDEFWEAYDMMMTPPENQWW